MERSTYCAHSPFCFPPCPNRFRIDIDTLHTDSPNVPRTTSHVPPNPQWLFLLATSANRLILWFSSRLPTCSAVIWSHAVACYPCVARQEGRFQSRRGRPSGRQTRNFAATASPKTVRFSLLKTLQ